MLDHFFAPKVIAVIGASNNPKKLGYEVFKNLKKYGKGRLFPIHPKDDEIQGVKAYRHIKDIPDDVEFICRISECE